jgi:tRNA threonylcarbamoyladenosine biosynthesis protein TsaE
MITAMTKSPEDTQAFGAAVSTVLLPGDVVLLTGDMGAGKTTFVKGLGLALGVAEPITSPTFVLLHTYSGRIPLHHADLYRLDQVEEILDLGIMELIDDGGVALIEWADRGLPAFPTDVLRMQFSYDDDDENVRHFTFQGTGKKWADRVDDLTKAIEQWVVAQ